MNQRLRSIATLLLAALPMQAQLSQGEFRKPPLQARPAGLWAWLNGHVNHAQLTRELEEMMTKGMRGAMIADDGKLVSDLMIENHFASCRDLLDERGLQ